MLQLFSQQLKTFFKLEQPLSATFAQRILNSIYLLAFGSHSMVALIFCGVLRFYAPHPTPITSIMAGLLLIISVLQLPMALLVGYAGSYRQTRQGIIALTILLALLLGNSVWIAGFAWLVGAGLTWLLGFMAIVMVYYALGFLFIGAFARWASAQQPDDAVVPDEIPSSETPSDEIPSDEIPSDDVAVT